MSRPRDAGESAMTSLRKDADVDALRPPRTSRSSGCPAAASAQSRLSVWPTNICVMLLAPRVVEDRRDRDRCPRGRRACASCARASMAFRSLRLRSSSREVRLARRRWRTARRGTDPRCGAPPASIFAALARGVMQTRIRSCVPQDDRTPCTPQVVLELAIHDLGRQQERPLAQAPTSCSAVPRVVGLRRRIDHHDFVRPVDELLRHALGRRRAGDAADERLLLGDVLQIDATSRTEMPAASRSSTSW